LWHSKSFPLDYIKPFYYDPKRNLKKSLTHVPVEKLNRDRLIYAKTAFKLKNVLKNVVFKMILGVRLEK
jgi:hypothetical protein